MFTNRTIIMDCQNPNIVCKTIVCIIGPFSSKILIRVDVEIEIDIPIISMYTYYFFTFFFIKFYLPYIMIHSHYISNVI